MPGKKSKGAPNGWGSRAPATPRVPSWLTRVGRALKEEHMLRTNRPGDTFTINDALYAVRECAREEAEREARRGKSP